MSDDYVSMGEYEEGLQDPPVPEYIDVLRAARVELKAYSLVRQLLDGPLESVIACPDEYSAAQLLERMQYWIDQLQETP